MSKCDWDNKPSVSRSDSGQEAMHVHGPGSARRLLGVASCEWSSVANAYVDLNHLAGLDVGTLECSVYCIRGSAGACLS